MNGFRWVLCLLPISCLAQFDPFDEDAFLDEYVNLVCPMIMDCVDGSADNSWGSEIDHVMAECEQHARSSSELGCTIRANYAISCYDDAVERVDEIYSNNDCSIIPQWQSNTGNGCALTYVDCVTDQPFNTYRPEQYGG